MRLSGKGRQGDGESESSGLLSTLRRLTKEVSSLQFILCNESLAKSTILVKKKRRKVMFIEHLLCVHKCILSQPCEMGHISPFLIVEKMEVSES